MTPIFDQIDQTFCLILSFCGFSGQQIGCSPNLFKIHTIVWFHNEEFSLEEVNFSMSSPAKKSACPQNRELLEKISCSKHCTFICVCYVFFAGFLGCLGRQCCVPPPPLCNVPGRDLGSHPDCQLEKVPNPRECESQLAPWLDPILFFFTSNNFLPPTRSSK